uniref:uncharacterized protein LOC100179756 isoform X2 n=1 Tax=Ciona intestinalis TaxID=7719 RepID=UPI00052159DA|nr:uncharacterized protein LOC100179756 isoform X2 [Ciona intestinalis]|eukprot:XP_009861963.1 uncharacterized protein LOC100179756 isoform X2 [Ciona intestinalis]
MSAVVNTTPVIMTTPAVRPGNKLYAKEFKILGVIQIMLGTLSIITWTYALTLELTTSSRDVFVYISSGIWCGIFFLIAGILATVSSFNPNRCKVVAGMVMAIFAAIFAATMFGIEVAGSIIISSRSYYIYTPYSSYSCTPYYQASYYKSGTYIPYCSSPYRSSRYISSVYIPSKYISCPSSYSYIYNYYSQSQSIFGVRTSLATLHGFMAFFAIAELVVAIVHSVYCCKFSQTSNMAPQPVVQYTTTYPQTNFTGVAQQMPVTSIGQPIGGAYQNTVYPVTSVPYQASIYANQVAPVSSPPMSPVATGMSTASGSQGIQPPPNYSETKQEKQETMNS